MTGLGFDEECDWTPGPRVQLDDAPEDDATSAVDSLNSEDSDSDESDQTSNSDSIVADETGPGTDFSYTLETIDGVEVSGSAIIIRPEFAVGSFSGDYPVEQRKTRLIADAGLGRYHPIYCMPKNTPRRSVLYEHAQRLIGGGLVVTPAHRGHLIGIVRYREVSDDSFQILYPALRMPNCVQRLEVVSSYELVSPIPIGRCTLHCVRTIRLPKLTYSILIRTLQ